MRATTRAQRGQRHIVNTISNVVKTNCLDLSMIAFFNDEDNRPMELIIEVLGTDHPYCNEKGCITRYLNATGDYFDIMPMYEACVFASAMLYQTAIQYLRCNYQMWKHIDKMPEFVRVTAFENFHNVLRMLNLPEF